MRLTLRRLIGLSLRYLRAHRWPGLAALLTMVVDAAFTIALYAGVKTLIDTVVAGGSHGTILPILAALAILFIIATLANVARESILAGVEVALADGLRLTMLGHLQTLPLTFYERAGSGAIQARFGADVTVIKSALTRAFPTIVRYSMQTIVVVALLILFDWRLAVLVTLLFAVILALALVLAARSGRAASSTNVGDDHVLAAVREMIDGHRAIKVFGAERALLSDVEARMAASSRTNVRASLLGRLITRALESGVSLIQLIVAGAGVYMVLGRSLSVGSLAAFIGLLGVLGSTVVRVALALPEWLGAADAMWRVRSLQTERPGVQDAPGAPPLPRIGRDIRFDDVGFAYPGADFSLRHVDLTAPFGQSVALVGRNGSGKSTLLALLLRLWDPQEGGIVVDGHDLRTVTQESLHEQCGVVFQETFLLNRSVRENIALGRAATDREIEAAARAAHIDDVIAALPRGYDTLLGERGAYLSGGQRQRLALARALLRNPAILLLDEATSALDPAAEAAFTETVWHLPGKRTIISVTHRLASAVDADHIVVVEAGRVVEQGTHQELWAAGGAYRHLWDKQAGFVVDDTGRRARVTADRLRDIPLFATADDASLVALADRFEVERYEAGDTIVREGDAGDTFYLIARGAVDVVTTRHGGEVELAVLEDGDYFGEIALISDVPRTATVRARARCLILALARDPFDELRRREPALRASIERSAAARSQETVAARTTAR